MRVYVNYENKTWKKYDIDFEKIASAAVLDADKDAEVSVTLVNDKKIRRLNKQYRGVDKPTNVLSFELGDDLLLGDIFISLDTVVKEAHAACISVEEHTAHMIVHGMLHLHGYDHLNDKDAIIMEQKEIKILKQLGYKNPYEESNNDYPQCTEESCCPGRWITKLKSIKIRQNSFWQYFLASVFGIICSFGFAPFNLWMLSLFAIGGMYYLITRKTGNISFMKSWFVAFPFGAFYGMSMFWWVFHSVYVVPELTDKFAIWVIPGLLGIGLICGFILSLPFAVIRYISSKPANRAILFAVSWTLVLWLREWFLTGFPWNPISNITMSMPMVINSIALWGSLGLSFVIVGLIASFIELLRYRKSKSCIVVFVVYAVLFLIGCIYGLHNMHKSQPNNMENIPMIRIIQPAKSAEYKRLRVEHSIREVVQKRYQDLIDWAKEDRTVEPDIIVYPETVYPYWVAEPEFPLSRILNTNVIMGVLTYNAGKKYNSMVIADKTGEIQHLYNKAHLVPFGEYRPFGDIIPTPGQLSPGSQAKKIMSINTKYGDFKVAPAICYEIIFSDSLVPRGGTPDAVVNITNDTWFGQTPGVYQHLDMVRRYAIESGLPVIRANYSGISAFVMPDGNVESMLYVGQTGHLDGFVWGAHNTVYRILGRDMWVIIILLFSIIVLKSISVFQKKD